MPRPSCGCRYPVRHPPVKPKHARYALYWWAFISYHTNKKAAENAQGRLSYHEAEDSRITRI